MRGREETDLQPVIHMLRHGSTFVEIVTDDAGVSIAVMALPLPGREPPVRWPGRRDEITGRELS